MSAAPVLDIAGRKVGHGQPCFLIAEAGVNHNGDLEMARLLVRIAAEAGADAVKFQTFSAERTVTDYAPKAEYQLRSTDPAESQVEMLRRLELSDDAHRELLAESRRLGILFLSTPFDELSADFLETLGLPAFKIPSGEITNLPFLEHVARKGRPMIVSTGMATLAESEAAARAVTRAGNPGLILLHCTSAYPADPKDANLRAMRTMEEALGFATGYSDHTTGIEISLAAAALGACVIEKHFTLDRGLPGPDHAASLSPDELRALVSGVRRVEAALGHGRKEPAACEAEIAIISRKSIVAARVIPAGARITKELVAMKCPGTGFAPSMLDRVLGRSARREIPADAVITPEMLA